MGAVCGAADDVPEQLFTQGLQQVVLGLEVVVKRGPPDIGRVDDLLHSDFPVALLRHEFAERREDRGPGLLLPPVHSGSPSVQF